MSKLKAAGNLTGGERNSVAASELGAYCCLLPHRRESRGILSGGSSKVPIPMPRAPGIKPVPTTPTLLSLHILRRGHERPTPPAECNLVAPLCRPSSPFVIRHGVMALGAGVETPTAGVAQRHDVYGAGPMHAPRVGVYREAEDRGLADEDERHGGRGQRLWLRLLGGGRRGRRRRLGGLEHRRGRRLRAARNARRAGLREHR